VEAGAFVNPTDPTAPPTIQAFCVPIVYLDRDLLKVMKDTHGMTITTVVVKPRSRGHVKLRSANPADKPLVSPNLLKDPEDLREMIEGQRFFLRAFAAEPLKSRIQEIKFPDPARTDDETLAAHCRRMVKTNYHPASTARMGRTATPWRCSTRGCGCAGWRGCAWPTCRPAPTSTPATPPPPP
jgi:choline dehydrogenase-like flavoprotein